MRVQVKARNRSYEFESLPGEKVLFAGLRHEIELPYECASGTCGTCKAKLIEGEIADPWPEAPGRRYLKSDREFLMCQCVAQSDVRVEVASFVSPMDPRSRLPHAFGGTIRSTAMLTHDVMALEVALDQPCDFDAGQFVAIEVPGVPGYRGYSMVNFERLAQVLAFVVKKKADGGVSQWLFREDRKGTPVKLFGPLGRATFAPGIAKNILCIAGGSGIAGMMSILARACQESHFGRYQGHVFFGIRTMRDAFYLAELEQLARQCPDALRIIVALSDEDVPADAQSRYPGLRFARGLVHEVAAREMRGKFENVRAYLAGPPPCVDAAIRMLLLEAKLSTDNVRYDKFS
jgi:toluene monooxygenase electron transfer component